MSIPFAISWFPYSAGAHFFSVVQFSCIYTTVFFFFFFCRGLKGFRTRWRETHTGCTQTHTLPQGWSNASCSLFNWVSFFILFFFMHKSTHVHFNCSGRTHSQIVCQDCMSSASFLWVFVWNRWELIELPSWVSFREICQIKMSLQSSFQKPPTCSCDKCCSHIQQMCHKKHK